jgi:hypothetical protein
VTIQEMIRNHPQSTIADRDALTHCIEQCFSCAATCTSCADACLGEEAVAELVRCVRLNLDCADLCDTTGRVLSRQTAADLTVIRGTLDACVAACRACAEECERHAEHHEHCRVCAEACRRCEQACNDVVSTLG